MNQEQGMVGRPVGEAVAAIARREGRDPEAVREALDPVTAEGVVSADAMREAVADTSMVVATAENRTEFAGMAVESARGAAAAVADLDAVAARLDELGSELAAVEARAAALTDDLAAPVAGGADPEAVYRTAVELREVAAAAQGVALTADNLKEEAEGFEAWVTTADRRHAEFREDLDLLSGALDDLARAVEDLPGGVEDPARAWADASMRVRVVALLLADLRAELADLRELADRRGEPFEEGLADGLDDLVARRAAVAARLETAGEPAWRERFGARLAALDDDLGAADPPVDWGGVEETLDAHRGAAFGE